MTSSWKSPAEKLPQRVENAFLKLARAEVTVTDGELDESIVSEFFLSVTRLRDSIREQHHAISAAQHAMHALTQRAHFLEIGRRNAVDGDDDIATTHAGTLGGHGKPQRSIASSWPPTPWRITGAFWSGKIPGSGGMLPVRSVMTR